jgi:hypothetical protein
VISIGKIATLFPLLCCYVWKIRMNFNDWSHEKKSHILSRKPSLSARRELRDNFFKSIIKEKSLYDFRWRREVKTTRIYLKQFSQYFFSVVVSAFRCTHSTHSRWGETNKKYFSLSRKYIEKDFFHKIYNRRQEEEKQDQFWKRVCNFCKKHFLSHSRLFFSWDVLWRH